MRAIKDQDMGLFYLSIQHGGSTTPVESLLTLKDADQMVWTLLAAIGHRRAALTV